MHHGDATSIGDRSRGLAVVNQGRADPDTGVQKEYAGRDPMRAPRVRHIARSVSRLGTNSTTDVNRFAYVRRRYPKMAVEGAASDGWDMLETSQCGSSAQIPLLRGAGGGAPGSDYDLTRNGKATAWHC